MKSYTNNLKGVLFFCMMGMLLLLVWPPVSSAQFCQGSLGANIFSAGNFGSGTANTLVNDPGIAPGYIYTRTGPPSDGFYTITNNTGQWPGLYVTWLAVTDNSSDPNGYMMVVNASFDPGVFYREEITNLCENSVYQFLADIINLIQPAVSGHILPNVDFLIDGQVAFSTGDIPQTGSWNTYGFVFNTGPATTSLTLELRNNAPGGIGNDLALDNISFRACGPEARIFPEEAIVICNDDQPPALTALLNGNEFSSPVFQWQVLVNGLWRNISGATDSIYLPDRAVLGVGDWQIRYLLANAPSSLVNPFCRVISEAIAVRVPETSFIVTDTICEGIFIPLGDTIYGSSGTYVDSLTSSAGCDSIVELRLEVQAAGSIAAAYTLQQPSCPGEADGRISVDSVSGGAPPYELEITDTDNQVIPNGQLAAGVYWLRIVDRFGCEGRLIFEITDPPPLLLSLGADIELQLGHSVRLDPVINQQVTSLQWIPSEGLSCPDCLNPLARPAVTTRYVLVASGSGNCVVSDTLTIFVEEIRKLYVPNIFTPNGDGINDFFTLYADHENVELIEEFIIFDRWGGIVFSVSGQSPGSSALEWRGRSKGEQSGAGVYTWYAKVRYYGQTPVVESGDLLLIR